MKYLKSNQEENTMQLNKQEICEACGHFMLEWNISSNCTLLKCPQCFHIKRDLELCNAQRREHAWGGSELFDEIRAFLTRRRLNKLLSKNKRLSLLEIGFGSGKILVKFLEKGHKVHGVEADLLEIHIDELLKKYGTLHFGKIENIQLPKEEFDLIYGIHVIEHLDNPAEVFKKCHDALKKEGILYFITPNSTSKGLTIFKDKWWNLEDPTHIRFFSPQSIKIMLNRAGFRKIEIGIPVWDSLTLEINSLLRFLRWNSKEHGVLSKKYAKLVDAFLLPFFIVIRMFYPILSPSLEVIAWKSP